jgi:2-amino-4-hydroxy-6-hydroxymethyldihydropteridine diphosphokinase
MRTGIALGSNLGDRLAQLRDAAQALKQIPGVSEFLRCSKIYETDPVDSDPDAPRYLNAVVEIDFEGLAMDLLDHLQALEAQFGRPSKRPRNAPRTLDLDILYLGNLVLSNEVIVIPHPRLHLRRFVLQPLCDVAPDLLLPGLPAPPAQLLHSLKDPSGVRLFAENWLP